MCPDCTDSHGDHPPVPPRAESGFELTVGFGRTNPTRSWHVAINEMGRGRSKAITIRGSYVTSRALRPRPTGLPDHGSV
jgi:hypothetical protein